MAPFEIVRALWAVRVAVAVTAVVLPTPGTAIAENEAVPAPVAVGNMSQNVLATVILAPGQAAIPVAAPQAPALAVAAAAAEVPERPPQSLAPSIRRQDTRWIPMAGSCGCGSAMAVNPSLNDSRCYTCPPAGAGAEDSYEGRGVSEKATLQSSVTGTW